MEASVAKQEGFWLYLWLYRSLPGIICIKELDCCFLFILRNSLWALILPQAATAFGVRDTTIMVRHIVPNVMHLVLISLVLNFSDLILYEAVLTYVGVGVDPTTSSFGGMINLARSEMSRDPVVWWSFAAAFSFMVVLVLAANLFADAVRDAFDPRVRTSLQALRRRKSLPATAKAVA